MRPEAQRTGNLWRGPGVVCGALPIGHRLQLATGEPRAFGDTLAADEVAILVEPRLPPELPTFEAVAGEDEATTAKRRALHAIMGDCGACEADDVYDVPEEHLDRDIAAHGGAKG